jgi:hypothetical protein
MKPLTHPEKLVFGEDAKRHVVTGFVLENGIGAASEAVQARNHVRMIEEIEGPSAAAKMRAALEEYEQTGVVPEAAPAITPPKRRK